MKVLSVFGTRPEAIKMCPLVKELEQHKKIESVVCLTGQHRDMAAPILELFGIHPAYNLDIMRPEQTLTTITTDILTRLEPVLKAEKPDIVLVHGDTTTSFAAALAAFYQQIPTGHVEAGLRTYDKYSPFPEEMNRTLTGRIAQYHFAPTENNRRNLEAEGVTEHIYVTGNTVIDAFATTLQPNYVFHEPALNRIDFEHQKCILMTAHRRENLGEALEQICRAVRRAAEAWPDSVFVYPMHLNPLVRRTAQSVLQGVANVVLVEPLDVQDMHNVMGRSYLVLTDSGGLQEEAPSLGVPVLVVRTETERPEAVEAGTVKVIGVGEEDIFQNIGVLMERKEVYQRMSKAVNPYGDGKASGRIAEILESLSSASEKMEDSLASADCRPYSGANP